MDKVRISAANKRKLTIKNRYGKNIYKLWGKGTKERPGGSPILRAWAKGRVRILK